MEFNINNENLKATNAWFICEYEVCEEEQKEKRQIAVRLFFAEKQPASIAFEELEYPVNTTNDGTDIETRQIADKCAKTLFGFSREAFVPELNAIPDLGGNESKQFFTTEDEPWASYLRNGLISASDLVSAVRDFNLNYLNNKIEEIVLWCSPMRMSYVSQQVTFVI